MTLEAGDPAPSVSAPNQHGTQISPSYDGPTVIYFYPKDDTSGCTTEATEFAGELGSYRKAGVSVFGVSTDDVDSHAAFAEKYGLEFDLLADPDGRLAEAFDVERRGGRAARTTFVVVDGAVYDVYTGVDPSGHARAVLSDLLDAGVVSLD